MRIVPLPASPGPASYSGLLPTYVYTASSRGDLQLSERNKVSVWGLYHKKGATDVVVVLPYSYRAADMLLTCCASSESIMALQALQHSPQGVQRRHVKEYSGYTGQPVNSSLNPKHACES